MLFAYVSGLGPQKDETDLCFVPDKPDVISVPVRVGDLRPTSAAVHRVGPEEAINVIYDEREKALIVTVLPPGSIYLTPNLMQSPGMRVRRLKIISEAQGIRTYFEKDRSGWEEWVANRERQ